MGTGSFNSSIFRGVVTRLLLNYIEHRQSLLTLERCGTHDFLNQLAERLLSWNPFHKLLELQSNIHVGHTCSYKIGLEIVKTLQMADGN